MQTRTHIPGQVLSQGAIGLQQNGNISNGSGLPWPRWQSEQDTGLRRHIVDNILQLFKNRKPHVTPEWQQKLPDFVKRLEEALYKNAPTKDEYADLKTLEQRLQSVARRMVPKQPPHSVGSSAPISSMIPTPGVASNMIPTPGSGSNVMQSPGSVGSMMPTPETTGSFIQSGPGVAGGLNNMISSTGNSNVLNSMTHGAGTMMPTPGALGNMMPTPGHSNLFNMSGSNIMTTPGTVGSTYSLVHQQAIGSMRVTQNGHVPSTMGMPVASQMIPTPGLNTSQGLGMSAATSAGSGVPNVGGVGTAHLQHQQQQQQFGTANHMYGGMSGQLSGSLPSGLQQQRKSGVVTGGMNSGMVLSNGQHLMNGAANLHTAPAYLNTVQYSSLQQQRLSQQHQQQQHQSHQLQQHQLQSQQQQTLSHQPQQHQRPQTLRMQSALPNPLAAMAGDGYAMNAADLAGGSFSSGSPASNSLTMAAVPNSPAPKMIPVPGLPSQQQQQTSLQQQIQQRNLLHQPSNSLTPRNQQQQLSQLSNNESLYQLQGQQLSGLGGQKQAGQDQSPQQPMSSQMQQPASDSQQYTRQHPSTQSQIPTVQQQPQVQQQIWRQQQQQHLHQHQQQGTQAQRQQAGVQHPLNRLAKPALQQRQALNLMHQRQGQGQQLQSPQPQLLQQQQQVASLPVPQSQPHLEPQLHLQPQSQSQQQQSQAQPHLQQQQRVSGATQMPLQIHQQLNQASQQSVVGHGLLQQQPLLPGQLQQIHLTQPLQAVGATSSALSPNAMTTCGQVGGVANGPLPGGSSEPGGSGVDAQRQQQYSKQQRWLLFLRHASKCTAPEGHCQITPHCHMARQLWTHIASCRDRDCTFSRCNASRTLLHHHQHCRDARCPVCGPVRQQVMNQQRLQANSLAAQQGGMIAAPLNSVTPGLTSSSVLSPCGLESSPPCDPPVLEELDVQQPPAKRVKIEPPSDSNVSLPLSSGHPSGPSKLGAVTATSAQSAPRCQTAALKSEQSALKMENSSTLGPSSVKVEQQVHAGLPVQRAFTAQRTEQSGQVRATESRPQNLAESHSGIVAVPGCSTLKGDSGGIGTAIPTNPSAVTSTKIGKPKNCGTSLTELFTSEQIREHIIGLRQWVGQSKAKAEKNQAMEHQMSENACRLCAVEKLTFEPPPIYCTACGARIKRNASYYTTGSGDTRHYFCVPCYNEVRSENVEMEGMIYPKAKLERKKNDEETEEAWVQCDKCNLWQHQVCALFNGRRNEGDSEYICPECCCIEMERGERKSLPSSAVLGAKDLPKTFLSDHLEQRLTRKLKQERAERAKAQGKGTDEVPGAEALVVRVVSSVDKKLEVKQRFLEIFQEEDYPTEYPYRSKVVLLFQKIEGVEVCLFGMYVQEFGVESSRPNQRRVYLSYLDSVKYFRPDVRTANGEALRTFVYHEILIGYLDYCRRRGFSSCYIWACPPLKGEDYILYCHPEIQKTPKSDKLRDWYLTMLRKASSDGIVVEITNLYDHFFTSTGECKAKVTAARLPYFDGDYWPGAAEDMIVQLQQEEEDVRKNALKKGKTKKQPSKRFSKGLAQVELASNASKDSQLMLKLGESIFPMKEDFIMVHMHHACTHCRLFIVSGHRWVCKQCKSFQLCDKCYDVELTLEERDRHPINVKEMHLLQPVDVNDIPCDTKDKDESMESEFFDTRQAFLSLCQGNHYQYDTLRRAKHSSMMVLYHLHNPTAPAFVVSCNICHLDIETGNGWRCETCADFDLCNKCKDTANHPHKLAPFHDRTAQNKEARQQRVLQLRKMLELLVHASQCGLGTCQYPKCRSVKGLFRHGMNCRIRASGGCNMCKRMWYLLQLHARACKESECRVPRCKDLKEHLRRLNQQMESRRRVAVKEMMRQRAAEAAGSNN